MAGYGVDWENRQGGWSGGRAGRGRPSGGMRGGRPRGQQPWPSRRPGNWSGRTGEGYGSEYRSRGVPPTVYRPGSRHGFGPGSRRDFGPASRRDFGPASQRGFGPGYDFGYNAAYGRDFTYEGGRGGAPWSYRRGGGTEYGADFGAVDTGRGWSGGSSYGSDYERREPDEPSRRAGTADFRGRPERHCGHAPVDRRPARQATRSERTMDDDDVRESVRENLFQDSFVNPDRIDVQVDRGVVTLRGEVDDFLQARYAWDDAWESPGVRGVVNNLTVRTDRAGDEMQMPQTRQRLASE